MFCPNCGKESSAKFCMNCGAKMPDGAPVQQIQQPIVPPVQQPAVQPQPMQYATPPKKSNSGVVIAVIVGVIISLALLAIIVNGLSRDSGPSGSSGAPQGDSTSVASAEESDAPSSDSDHSKDEMPLEIIESGYFLKRGSKKFYIQYAVSIKNKSGDTGIKFPAFRITARDADGGILATEDQVLTEISPGETIFYAFQGPSVDVEPDTVEFEPIFPEDYNLVSPDMMDYPNLQLGIENARQGSDSITGEVSNSSDVDVSSARVTVIFRDDAGNIVAGETTFIDSIRAGSRTPFEVSANPKYDDYVTTNFEIYAYPW